LNLVSNMRTTCERISSHVEQLYGDPALNDGSHRLHLTSASSTSGSTTTIQSSVEGCGNYFICGWCKGDCLISVVQEYFFNVFNDEIPSDRPTISPAVNVKYSLFVQPVEMCDTFGMLSSKAKLFKGMRPGEGKELVISSSSSSSSSYFHEPGMLARVSSVLIMLPAIVVTLMLLVRYLFRRRIIITTTSQMDYDNSDSSINGGSSGSKYMGVFSSEEDDDIDDTSTFKYSMEERKKYKVKQYSNF